MKYYLALVVLTLASAMALAQKINFDNFKEYTPRNIGPAGMSGRVTAVVAQHNNPNIIYAGTASGGLWRSTSGGTAWEPIFEKEKAISVGAVALDPTNPDVIWVGTGEGNPRNSLSSGFGVYRSQDGGRTWQHMGLEKTRNIHRLIVDPSDPNTIYVGAIGSPWGEHPERGVFKSSDAGKTWNKVLFVNNKTGVADMVMDPQNPNKLIVAMWEHRRWPWYFNSGGEGSGLHITYDGGTTWKKMDDSNGLPESPLGRIGLAIARSEPSVVYAWVESKSNNMYRSEDGGFNWEKVSKDKDSNIGSRPFYYAEIYVDPNNENRVYSLHTRVTVSEDGGKTFSLFVDPSFIHVDNHAFYINPLDPNFLILGNDGGMEISRDRGETWNYSENLPIGQFYHVQYDMETPYNVYGGMQDNGSWRGPSQVWRRGGIRNMFWERIGGGDGFDVVPDLLNPRYGYSLSQGGNLRHYDRTTGGQVGIKPTHPDGLPLRFNWNTAIAMDPFDKKTLYLGSQHVMKSSDQGKSWSVISPDLTTNDPDKQKQATTGGLNTDNSGAENFTSLVSLEPSSVQQGVIWAGADDGSVHVTRDGGATWSKVNDKMKGLAQGSWATQIRASTYNAGEVFVVFDDHRRDNWTPYVFRTKDYGKSWERLVDDSKVWGYALSFVQDPIEPNLMFCGTEFGLYVSVDGGSQWSQWTSGYPSVSTMDMQIHPREHDLILGTFGRAIWILDDIRPLRQIAKDGLSSLDNSGLSLFAIPDTYLHAVGENIGYRSTGHAFFTAKNKDWGAMISYYLSEVGEEENTKELDDDVRIDIYDGTDTLVRTLFVSPKKGFNRLTWGLERDGVRRLGEEKPKDELHRKPRGHQVLPGNYTIKVSYNGKEQSQNLVIKSDPRLSTTMDEMVAKNEMIIKQYAATERVTNLVDHLTEAKTAATWVNKQIKEMEGENYDSLRNHSKVILDKVKELRELVLPKEMQGFSNNPALVSSKISNASRALQSVMVPITENQRKIIEQSMAGIEEPLQQIRAFFEKEWVSYKAFFDSLEIEIVPDLK